MITVSFYNYGFKPKYLRYTLETTEDEYWFLEQVFVEFRHSLGDIVTGVTKVSEPYPEFDVFDYEALKTALEKKRASDKVDDLVRSL